MGMVVKKLKLKNKINLVFYISIFLITSLVISFQLLSEKINNNLVKNINDLEHIRGYYNNINKDLKNLNYLTIEHSLNIKAYYDIEDIYQDILLNIKNLKNDHYLQDNKKIVKVIDDMEETVKGYKFIADSFEKEIIKDYKEGLYFILAITLNNNEINEELSQIDSMILEISKNKYDNLNNFIFNVRISMTIFILFIAGVIFFINKQVEIDIIKQLKNLEKGVTSFFEVLTKKREDIIYMNTDIDDEISQIARIINHNISASKNLIFSERESAHKIEQRVKEATKEIQMLNDEIEATQREVILTLSIVGEERSNETGYHVMRVAEYSLILARLAGLSLEESILVKSASPMHDIGKIGIPDAILNKPSNYTPEEYAIMKKHPEIGYRMLKHSDKPILKAASIICYEHHEKWDGSGYPHGIKGEDIHIYGRITAIADVFDALGSDRVYKKAWSLKDIYELFEKESSKHFDPNLVELFLDNLECFIAARENIESKDEEASLSDFIVNFDKVDDII